MLSSRSWSSKLAREVVEYIRTDAPQLWERPPDGTLNLKNGLLDIATRELKPHSTKFLSTVQLPVAYEPEARCPATEKFVQETFPEDAVKAGVAWQIVAWLMLAQTSIQKALLLQGEGANGKSTWLRALIAFLGRHNVSTLSLHKLEGDRFATSRLWGKLANICSDLPSAELAGSSVFKALTGGDSISAEYKFKESFDLVPFARLVFSANHLPRSADASHAFFRRWLVIPFNQTFEGEKEINSNELDARLADPTELSGVLNKALEALPNVRANGITETQTMKAAWHEFRQTTDPKGVWFDKDTIEGTDQVVIKDDLWLAFQRDCERRGRPCGTKQGFGRTLKQLRPNVEEAQRTGENGKVRWVWKGISLKAQDEGEDKNPTGTA